jgi:hypothetical protein
MLDYFVGTRDAAIVTWAHAVNSKQELLDVLNGTYCLKRLNGTQVNR